MADEADLCMEDSAAVGTRDCGRCPWLQGLFFPFLPAPLSSSLCCKFVPASTTVDSGSPFGSVGSCLLPCDVVDPKGL